MKFTRDHLWIDLEGEVAAIGVTAYRTEQLGEVVAVSTAGVGMRIAAGDRLATIESVEAADTTTEFGSPVAGEVAETNAALADAPELLVEDPEGGGWLVKLRLSDPADLDALMDRAGYEAFLQTMG